MVGNIATKIKVLIEPIPMEISVDALNKYIGLWYSKFKSNDAIKDGNLNEEPTFEKLKRKDCIVQLHEVGLLREKIEPSIGVSLDGVVVLQMDHEDD